MSNNQENRVKAAQLFRNAANKGNPEAQFQYVICLRDGDGVPPSLQEATEWFRKAANAGHPGATQALNALQRPDQPALQMANATPPTTNLPTVEKATNGSIFWRVITWPYRVTAEYVDTGPTGPDKPSQNPIDDSK